MTASPRILRAEVITRLPPAFHMRGVPSEWARITRPEQDLHSFLEGPCLDEQGAIWVVDVPYGRLLRVAPDGTWTVNLTYEGEPHSVKITRDGTFLIADARHGLLSWRQGDASVAPVCERVNLESFRALNDLAVAGNGDIWFTDSGRSSLADPTGRVFRRRRDGRVELRAQGLPYPNGIALSPDCRFVYVALTRANAVLRLMADAPDVLLPMSGIFVHLSGGLGPDGLAVDRHGRLAVAQAQAGRVYLLDSFGDLIAIVLTPGGTWTTACAFSSDASELLIVEAQTGAIYRASLEQLPSHALDSE